MAIVRVRQHPTARDVVGFEVEGADGLLGEVGVDTGRATARADLDSGALLALWVHVDDIDAVVPKEESDGHVVWAMLRDHAASVVAGEDPQDGTREQPTEPVDPPPRLADRVRRAIAEARAVGASARLITMQVDEVVDDRVLPTTFTIWTGGLSASALGRLDTSRGLVLQEDGRVTVPLRDDVSAGTNLLVRLVVHDTDPPRVVQQAAVRDGIATLDLTPVAGTPYHLELVDSILPPPLSRRQRAAALARQRAALLSTATAQAAESGQPPPTAELVGEEDVADPDSAGDDPFTLPGPVRGVPADLAQLVARGFEAAGEHALAAEVRQRGRGR